MLKQSPFLFSRNNLLSRVEHDSQQQTLEPGRGTGAANCVFLGLPTGTQFPQSLQLLINTTGKRGINVERGARVARVSLPSTLFFSSSLKRNVWLDIKDAI